MYKIDILLKQGRKLFHTNDLSILWQITNQNTLYTTIKRYVKKGILIPIHKGFYATVPVNKINQAELGISYLHQYAYLSTESVLVNHGVIFQKSENITLVANISKNFTIGNTKYIVRKMKESYLFQTIGITTDVNGVKTATLNRAVADLLYFNRNYYFDNRKAVNWVQVKQLQIEIGYL